MNKNLLATFGNELQSPVENTFTAHTLKKESMRKNYTIFSLPTSAFSKSSLMVLFLWMMGFANNGYGQTLVFSQAFNGNASPANCTAWDNFRAAINGTANYYGSIQINSGPIATGAAANSIIQALKNGVTLGATASGGYTWQVGICGGVELSANNSICGCGNGYVVRPCIANVNWGSGDGGTTCGHTAQTVTVTLVPNCTSPISSYSVTGGGSYCAGGSGVAVGLSNSQTGVYYQLYNGASAVGSTVSGSTGSAISFGNQTSAGTYTVRTTTAGGYCALTMTGSVAVAVNPSPSIPNTITGNTTISCINSTTTLSSADPASGGTLTVSGTTASPSSYYNIRTFTSGGTFNLSPSSLIADVLVVAGGGGGGQNGGGGGGGGGVIYSPSYTISGSSITVTVGSGGTAGINVSGGSPGARGGNSIFGPLTAIGGGGGANRDYGGNATTGGSGGGGGGGNWTAAAAGTLGQGYASGIGYNNGCPSAGGGGGGASAVGTAAGYNAGGTGGNGVAYSISGTSVYYAGGGGGGPTCSPGTYGPGGLGGANAGTSATANTGGGGGGNGGTGGSGIVIVRYPKGIWSSDNTSIATVDAAGVVTGKSAGTTTIRYTVTNSGGCSSQVSTSVTVNAFPAPTPVTASPTTVCAGGSSNLNAISSGNNIKWWTAPTGGTLLSNTASGANYTVSPTATTTYYAEADEIVSLSGSQTFNYTGGLQTFVVPAGITSLTVDASGAAGGNGTTGAGGNGGRVQTAISVTPGQTLNIYVGGVGGSLNTGTPGYNGGGSGSGAYSANIGGGGGASDIRIGGTALANRVIVAGGGGGGAYNGCGNEGGGAGGGATGAIGGLGCGNTAAGGGSSIAGGAGATYTSWTSGASGTLGNGGNAGSGTGGGGGGGGYYGGGGGSWNGGGGGSNYPIAGTQGYKSGNGQIILTWTGTGGGGCTSSTRTPVTVIVNLPSVALLASVSPAGICSGQSSTLTVNSGLATGGLIDRSTWTVGTGSAPGFTQNGLTIENSRINGTDPWGNSAVVWEGKASGDVNDDGGWNGSQVSIDNSKTYRYSVWVKRTVQSTAGRFYFGLQSNTGGATTLGGGFDGNPYFWYSSSPAGTELPTGEWVLVVGYVHPVSYAGGTEPTSGRYTNSAGRYAGINYDYKWTAGTTTASLRTYLYYADVLAQQQWVYPRIDVVDGTEPSIDNLLSGFDVNSGLGTGATWQWNAGSCGGSSAGTGASVSVSPTTSTDYFVRAVGTCNTTPCKNATVTVNQKPTTPTITASGATTFCPGGSVQLTAASSLAGNALSFDGSGMNVNMGSPTALQITGNQTIEMWLKPNNFSARRNPYNKAYAGEGTITQETNGTLNYYWGNLGSDGGTGGVNYQGFGSGFLTLNQWNHIALVRDLTNNQLLWYINGVLSSTTTPLFSIATAGSSPVLIGAGYAGGYDGAIDEVRVWNIARTSTDIQNNMNTTVAPGTSGLAGYWRMDEGSGTQVLDASGNSTTGTFVAGTPTWLISTAPLTPAYTWSPGTGLNTTSGSVVTANPSSTQIYTVSATSPHGCGSSTNTQTVTITPATAISAQSTATQTKCIGSAFTAITVTATGTPTITYQWYSNTTASNTGGTSLGSSNGAQTSSYTPQSTAVGTLYYYCVVSSGCGASVTSVISGAFIVTPATAISAQSTATQTKCIGSAFTAITVTATGTPTITYQWYSNTTASNTGGTSLGSSNGAQTSSYTPQSTAVGTLYYYCVVSSGCGASVTSVISGAFIVTSANTVGLASSSPPLCINTPLTNITHSTTGATGIGTATGLPTGVTAAWASNTITISGTPSVSGPFSYSIPLSGGCGTVSATGTINVDALPTAPNAGADVSVCGNSVTLGATPNSGSWTTVTGTGSFTSTTVNNPTVTGLTNGTNTFAWKTVNGTCELTDAVTITGNYAPTAIVHTIGTHTATRECLDASTGWTHYYDDNGGANTASNRRLISLKKNGNNIGTVGDGTFNGSLVLENNYGNDGYLITTANAPYVQNNVNAWAVMARYWNVIPTQQPSSNVDVTFYYDNTDYQDVLDQAATQSWETIQYAHVDLQFYKVLGGKSPAPSTGHTGYMSNEVVIYDKSSSPTWSYASFNTDHSATYSVSSFSGGGGGFGGGGQGALPVKLLYFTAKAIENQYAQLDWATAIEIDNKGFEVERSVDGVSFENIGWVVGNNNSTSQIVYSFDDKTAKQDIRYYYRLKQIDFDGDFEYSSIASAILLSDLKTAIGDFVPNPTGDKSYIEFFATKAQTATITVFDAMGKLIRNESVAINKGFNTYNINAVDLASSVYMVNFRFDDQRFTKRLNVVK